MSRMAVLCLCFFFALAAHAQTFTTLVNFDLTNGDNPVYGTLVQDINGDFYGTTVMGGSNYLGTIFKVTPQGQLTSLHSFSNSDGAFPENGLTVAPNRMLYGTTDQGGASLAGTIFRMTSSGALTTFHSFDGADGADPGAVLTQAFNGMIYGTTNGGGASGYGTIFQIAPSGTLTTLHSFSVLGGAAGLVQAANGMLYGTTFGGGANGYGTIYSIGLRGAFTTLYSFGGPDGAGPQGATVEGSGGNFYGTTTNGGANGYGTVFRVTSAGQLTSLHSFENTDGAAPAGTLVQGTDGNFYGTATAGGANVCSEQTCGTAFKITPGGSLTVLHTFDGTDGYDPSGGLVQGTDGNFYGTTAYGGSNGHGTVFRLSIGLGPFVKTLPAFGKVGRAVVILGTDLTGATSVTFNGRAASFTILSPTAIRTTVPSGASTGTAQVVTPSGTLASNVPFQVL